MNERAQLIKTAIAQELIKEGKTLQDLEQELTKTSAAFFDVSKAPETVKNFFNAISSAAVGGGMLAGTGMYGAYLANEDSTNKQLKKMKEMQQYQTATNALKADMQNPLTL